MGDLGAIATAVGGSTAAILAAWALVVKARGTVGTPLALLRRLWDWIEGNGLTTDVPPTLRADVLRELNRDEDTDGPTG